MRHTVRQGGNVVEFLPRWEAARYIAFSAERDVVAFLRRSAADPHAMGVLRQLLAREASHLRVGELADADVIARLAPFFADGRILVRIVPRQAAPIGDWTAEKGERPTATAQEKTWVEIQLVGEDGSPIPGVRYEITVPGKDKPITGVTDEQGVGNVEAIDPGTCEVTFPDLDAEAWEAAS